MVAQIMVAAAGGYVSPEAEAVLIDVLKRDPQNGMALYLSGLMFAQVGRADRAFALWEPLLAKGPADAPWMAPIQTDIQAIADEAGIKYRPAGAGKGPSMADMQAAGEMSAKDRQAMIEGMVGQLEGRLFSKGGSVEEWLKLMNALGVLGQPDRGKAALAAAEKALAADPAALEQVRAAATAAGFAP
jgi:cytochrome c-type biogenesis protein CcmH